MSPRHDKKLIDQARNELFSHVIRCDVLEASVGERLEWLDETMGYLTHRYPQLEALELAHLKTLGNRFVQPAIPHGAETHGANRDEWQPQLTA